MANALKKITTQAKKIRKKHPGKSWKAAVKQAGADYRSGKLKKRRSAPKRKVARKRKARPRKVASVGKVRRVTTRRKGSSKRRAAAKPRIRIRTRTVTKTVRVGRSNGSSKLLPILAIGAVAVGAYLLLKRPAPVLIQSTNPQRNNLAADILGYATAGGMIASEIAKLIATINNSSDAQVQKIYDNVKTGQQPYANIAGCISYN